MQPKRCKWLGAEAANGLSQALGFPAASEPIGTKVGIDQRSEPACLFRRYPSIRSSDREIMTGIDASVFMVGKNEFATRCEFDWATAHRLLPLSLSIKMLFDTTSDEPSGKLE